MREIADTLTLGAPASAVWAAIESPDEHAKWHPFATAIKGAHALGEVRECSVLIRGSPGTTRETCITYDAGQAITWRVDADSSGFSRMVTEWTSGFRLAQDRESTVVTAWSNFRPKWFVLPMLPMIRSKFHQTQREILAGLRLHVEGK